MSVPGPGTDIGTLTGSGTRFSDRSQEKEKQRYQIHEVATFGCIKSVLAIGLAA
jgi:hypothetical protein